MATVIKWDEEDGAPYRMSGMMSSSGRLHFTLRFDEPIRDALAISTAADVLMSSVELMTREAHIDLPSLLAELSPEEIAEAERFKAAYWERLMLAHLLPYSRPEGDSIAVGLIVPKYIRGRLAVARYASLQNEAIKRVQATTMMYSPLSCPECQDTSLRFAKNTGEVNGVCDSGCGFQFKAAVNPQIPQSTPIT